MEGDPERAPFVKLALELYATGDYSITDIVEEPTARGFTTRPTTKHPAWPISVNKVHRMLASRYYLGYVPYEDEEFEGNQPRIIDHDLFERVRAIRRPHGRAAERRRVTTTISKAPCTAVPAGNETASSGT